nr:PIN domain-containing protein [Mycetohabitans sp. B8]
MSPAGSHKVWTEDADFFGTGVATWTTNRIQFYLN